MTMRPFLTVIVPAFNATATVRASLDAIVESDLSRGEFELILVDDGSTDETSLVGAEYCDRVVRLSGRPNGPAFARNRGAEVARGDVLVFVDADVVVHKDALRRLAERFRSEPQDMAVFGSYDDKPANPGFVSQYRNLLHHYVHQRGRGEAQTFWAGLGAIRIDEFRAVGMFDEWHYGRPQIEDIELGRRVHLAGHRIVLDPDILGTHLKRWTLSATLLADFQHRGIPWMWLLLKEGTPATGGSLNVRAIEKLLTALAALALLMPVLAVATGMAHWLLVMGAIALIILFANIGFYIFLVRIRSPLFAMAVMPLHLMYYSGNAVSVVMGWFVHLLFGEPIPSAGAAAHAQIGIATWPPPPRRSEHSLWEQRQRNDRGGRMSEPTTLPLEVEPAFEPLHKRAFGMAIGGATGLLFFALTAVILLRQQNPAPDLRILCEYFYGYTVSWEGAFIALAWGFVAGFAAGWFAAFSRNFVIAASIWLGQNRSELEATRDFLDHI